MKIRGIFFRRKLGFLVMSDYKEDWLKAVETQEPWLILVSESWCGPCQQIKSYIQKLKAQGIDIHYTILPTSDQYAKQLMKGNSSIPQWFIWKWNSDVEKFDKLHSQIGSQNHEEILNRIFVADIKK